MDTFPFWVNSVRQTPPSAKITESYPPYSGTWPYVLGFESYMKGTADPVGSSGGPWFLSNVLRARDSHWLQYSGLCGGGSGDRHQGGACGYQLVVLAHADDGDGFNYDAPAAAFGAPLEPGAAMRTAGGTCTMHGKRSPRQEFPSAEAAVVLEAVGDALEPAALRHGVIAEARCHKTRLWSSRREQGDAVRSTASEGDLGKQ
ncbi:hypothetical protein C8R45DRAFT_931602 [Mycena sanguinolenta]|nr:hypothetical protein C8R45DRAFT_931602 [Mycena sanguinolenta]